MISLQFLKLLHLLGVTLFMGNIIVSAVWKIRADRTRNPRVIAHAQRLVNMTDLAFTAPGAALIFITGTLMTPAFGGITAAWLSWGLALFTATGIIWALVLIPIQVMQGRLARSFSDGGEIPARYWRLGKIWTGAGLLATVLPIVNFYLMVFKPE